ncbi:MAG TPA: hypothetical protein VHE60_19315 [Pyrinomonadaceae bacterium]|nr:hypothetical protein [Pyrinomonadaceae bacterium]
MDPILSVLSQLGLGLATSGVYDLLKGLAARSVSRQEFTNEVQNRISMMGVSMRAETVIDALVREGFLTIEQSNLYASESLNFGSYQGGAIVGNNSSMRTDKTAIEAGAGAFLETQGNAQVRQNPDGSISFHTGEDASVSFKTSK